MKGKSGEDLMKYKEQRFQQPEVIHWEFYLDWVGIFYISNCAGNLPYRRILYRKSYNFSYKTENSSVSKIPNATAGVLDF